MSYTSVTVTSSSTLILENNPMRLSLIFYNNGSQTVFIGQDADVSTANGVPIIAGANLTEDSGGAKVYCGPFYGVASSGTSEIRYWERTR